MIKKFIKYLANVSGVTKDIERQTLIEVGRGMQDYSYWFSGGLMHNEPLESVRDILTQYPKECLLHGQPTLFGSQFVNFRSKIYKLHESRMTEKEKILNESLKFNREFLGTLTQDKLNEMMGLYDDEQIDKQNPS